MVRADVAPVDIGDTAGFGESAAAAGETPDTWSSAPVVERVAAAPAGSCTVEVFVAADVPMTRVVAGALGLRARTDEIGLPDIAGILGACAVTFITNSKTDALRMLRGSPEALLVKVHGRTRAVILRHT